MSKTFIYLGSEFTWDNDCSKDILWFTLATAVYSELQSIWKDSGIMIDVKLQLLMTIVFQCYSAQQKHGPYIKRMKKDYLHLI